MAAKLLIDGYNLIGKLWGLDKASLELLREKIIKKAAEYKKIKKMSVVIVFDGENAGWMSEGRERIQGIDIYYSRDGEKADDLIARMSEKGGERYILVSSDNELISRCERYGTINIKSEEFIGRMKEAEMYGDMTKDGEKDYGVDISSMTKKKGNPKRRSKKERQRRQKISKV